MQSPKRLKELSWTEKGELTHAPNPRHHTAPRGKAWMREGALLAILCAMVFALTLGALQLMG